MDIKHIRVASDLHLEGFIGAPIPKLVDLFIPPDVRDAASILVLAGDISSKPDQLVQFIEEVAPAFAQVIVIPGNHEFYRHVYPDWVDGTGYLFIEAFDNKNVHWCLDGVGAVKFDDVQYIYGTLWGDGGPTLADRGAVGHGLNDFRVIQGAKGRHFTVPEMVAIHKKQKASIEDLLTRHDGRNVVITHHLPSRRLVSKRFIPQDGSDGINGGFVGDCDNILAADNHPWLWIHGHTHDTIDTMMWDTRVVCNPAGYRGEWATPYNEFMKPAFDPNNPVSPKTVPKFIDL